MQGVQQSYTQYFNRKYEKVGHLFQGRYKAIVCEKDEYLPALVRYIHLNPVRARTVQRPEEYGYSSHAVYLTATATEVVNPTRVLRLLGGGRVTSGSCWMGREKDTRMSITGNRIRAFSVHLNSSNG